jgi:hypothetical protein
MGFLDRFREAPLPDGVLEFDERLAWAEQSSRLAKSGDVDTWANHLLAWAGQLAAIDDLGAKIVSGDIQWNAAGQCVCALRDFLESPATEQHPARDEIWKLLCEIAPCHADVYLSNGMSDFLQSRGGPTTYQHY